MEEAGEWYGDLIDATDGIRLQRGLLRLAADPGHSVGSDQFVYFDASDARRCLAPDAFSKRGVPFDLFESWKTWERGVPELCVEILSVSDTQEKLAFREKLERRLRASLSVLWSLRARGDVFEAYADYTGTGAASRCEHDGGRTGSVVTVRSNAQGDLTLRCTAEPDPGCVCHGKLLDPCAVKTTPVLVGQGTRRSWNEVTWRYAVTRPSHRESTAPHTGCSNVASTATIRPVHEHV